MTAAHANIGELQALADAQAFIGIRKVCEIAGFSKATILRKIAARRFPSPVIREGNVTRWDLAECLAWRVERLKERAERNAQQEHRQAA